MGYKRRPPGKRRTKEYQRPDRRMSGQFFSKARRAGNAQQKQKTMIGKQPQSFRIPELPGASKEHENPQKTAFQVFQRKDCHTGQNGNCGIHVPPDCRQTGKIFQQKPFFQNQKNTKIHAPDQKIPSFPMPDSGQRPDDQDIAKLDIPPSSVTSQRNVNVLPKPLSQRYMPSSPKFRDAFRTIRIVKIFLQMKSHHLSHADGHVGVAGEIKIKLQRICHASDPGSQCTHLTGRQAFCRLPQSPIWFASNTFFPSPTQNLPIPLYPSSAFRVRCSSSCATSLYFTMGPAISWGNMAT